MAAVAALPPPSGLSEKAPTIAPVNQTLYVRGLPDQLPKDDLKRSLYMLFATYGVILDIIALKTPKMRGQAHVVFRDVDASTQAMRALDGSAFFDKDISISYARGRSHAIPKLAGTFMLPGSEKPALVEGGAAEADKATEAFGAAPNKAVPVENKERAKGTKRGREEEADEEEEEEKEEEKKEEEKKEEKKDEEEDDESSSGAEMEMGSSDEESE